jgi:hypothetical protein
MIQMKRQIIIFVVVSLVIFGVGYAIFANLFIPEEKTTTPALASRPRPLPPPIEPQSVLVKSVTGSAVKSGANPVEWIPVEPGNKLLVDQKIRTQTNGSVKLEIDENSKIEITGQSEMSVEQISDDIQQFHLTRGQMSVDFSPKDKRRLRITAAKNRAVASTQHGVFVIQNAKGEVSVAATQGEVALTAENETVVVKPNTVSRVSPGKAPAAPTPIPLRVMLRVANPKKHARPKTTTTITGKTEIGALVNVNNTPAEVDASGRFKAEVPLQLGKNHFEVVARTPWGEARRELEPLTITNSPPSGPAKVDSVKVRWGRTDAEKKRKTATP